MAMQRTRAAVERRRDIMKTISILIPMHLAGQAKRPANGETGYAMAALLVAMTIMAIMFTVVMPVWKQASTREKEEELVFRGKQYVHAIGLFQRKFANAYPPNIDVLVEQRFLRKKFKDPITDDDFVPIPVGTRRARHSATGWSARRAGRTGSSRTDAGSADAGSVPSRPCRRPGRAGGPGSRSDARSDRGRHQRRDQQEQGSIDSPLQRTRPLQRVGLRLHSTAAGSRRRRRSRFELHRDAAVNADSPANPPVRFQAAISPVSADAVPSVPTDPDAATAALERLAAVVSHRSSRPTPRGRF